MRIIAGDSRGISLVTLPGEVTRPTLARVKEGMFSAVQFWLPGAKVLDLYAGSGQLGLEALSRGATFCTFVDGEKRATEVIRKNVIATRMQGKCRVVYSKVETFLAHNSECYDLILLDPPYCVGALPDILFHLAPRCKSRAILLCESDASIVFPDTIEGLQLKKQYRYGDVVVTRYENKEKI